MKLHLNIILCILVGAFLAGCDLWNERNNVACTLEFMSYNLTVLTESGEPVEDAEIQIRNKESGETYEPCVNHDVYTCEYQGYEGHYTIFHDGFQELTEPNKTISLVVLGSKGDRVFSAEFSFLNDGCHIIKKSGPNTVRLYTSR